MLDLISCLTSVDAQVAAKAAYLADLRRVQEEEAKDLELQTMEDEVMDSLGHVVSVDDRYWSMMWSAGRCQSKNKAKWNRSGKATRRLVNRRNRR